MVVRNAPRRVTRPNSAANSRRPIFRAAEISIATVATLFTFILSTIFLVMNSLGFRVTKRLSATAAAKGRRRPIDVRFLSGQRALAKEIAHAHLLKTGAQQPKVARKIAPRGTASTALKAFGALVAAVVFPLAVVWNVDHFKVEKFKVQQFVKDLRNKAHAITSDPVRDELLPPLVTPKGYERPRTLVLDLEETLLAPEWDPEFGWRFVRRPHVADLLKRAWGANYEIVLFTAGQFVFMELPAAIVDEHGVVSHRLYRESTTYKDGVRIKDLSRLNRDLKRTIIVDDDPTSFSWQPENGVAVNPFTDKNDTEDVTLLKVASMLEDIAHRNVPDVREELERWADMGTGDVLDGFVQDVAERESNVAKRKERGIGSVMKRIGNTTNIETTTVKNKWKV